MSEEDITHGFRKFEVYKENQTVLNNAQNWRESTDLCIKITREPHASTASRPEVVIKWGVTIMALLENLY